ncbi:CaiB/BaiF CoA transferase family protein [Microbacterium sp. NPDC058062]|uniref:CaiB/BaiF CoA transferase family protein n=1 Tax=Microbacterium sp. NPDC058062 TaxID=3346320 RepID=UPI0036DC22EF
MSESGAGPLEGVKVLEFEGMGPGPLASMMLADMGAHVLRIDRPKQSIVAVESPSRTVGRGKEYVALNLKDPADHRTALGFIEQADVLIDSYRPGVMERIGLGPEVCLPLRPALVYGRMTGWGQVGPLAAKAGHDINFLAIAGLLNGIGRAGEPPAPPLNLVADNGGGAMLLAFGIACALVRARLTGVGEVIDAAMIDGSSLLMTQVHEQMQTGDWSDRRGENFLDGGAPFYDAYETRDGRYVAIGATEMPFFQEFLRRIGLPEYVEVAHDDRSTWPETKQAVSARLAERTRQEWVDLLEDADVCFTPVLTMAEARENAHIRARGGYVHLDGLHQPLPAPRLASGARPVGRSARPWGGRDDSVWK